MAVRQDRDDSTAPEPRLAEQVSREWHQSDEGAGLDGLHTDVACGEGALRFL